MVLFSYHAPDSVMVVMLSMLPMARYTTGLLRKELPILVRVRMLIMRERMVMVWLQILVLAEATVSQFALSAMLSSIQSYGRHTA